MAKLSRLGQAAGEAVKQVLVLVLEVVTIVTESLQVLANHLDAAVDEIQERLTKPPTGP